MSEKFYIEKQWRITNDEYQQLDAKFGKLTHHQSWQLFKNNSRNNHTDDQSDIAQDVTLALMKAGSYYKRQVYIEECLTLCWKYIKDSFARSVLLNLQDLWDKKTKHGAGRQKFGQYQEEMLFRLVNKFIPKSKRPNRNAALKLDAKFTTYCKSITWNHIKAMGKKITKEKVIRCNQVSLSEFDYLTN